MSLGVLVGLIYVVTTNINFNFIPNNVLLLAIVICIKVTNVWIPLLVMFIFHAMLYLMKLFFLFSKFHTNVGIRLNYDILLYLDKSHDEAMNSSVTDLTNVSLESYTTSFCLMILFQGLVIFS